MHTVVDIELAAPPERVWPHIADLASYPSWMHLVHRVDEGAPGGENEDGGVAAPIWDVELRARVGPFARSKRLRMTRTVHEPMERVRFERSETDERDHAEWILTATLTPSVAGSELSMDLFYSGGLWTGGILDTVLENEIRKGKSALQAAVEGNPGS